MKIRHVLLSSAVAAVLSTPSFADDLVVSSATTSALTTSAASGGSAGNITITSAGSVTIPTASAAAITIDSSNVVINQGAISNTASSSAIGVNLFGGNTGSFTNLGTITIPGSGTPPSATGLFGILLNGNGTFTGNITAGSGSSLSIAGATAQAIAIQAELAGNLTLAGTITATGSNSSTVLTTAAIDGAFINRGIISTVSGSTSTETSNPSPGIVVGFGGNIGAGFLNAGPINAADSTAAASIKTSSSVATVEIAPVLSADAGNISVGILSDGANPGFSFINRGMIANDGTQPAISTLAIQIGNPATDTNNKTTIFAGGILNSGTIRATATSDNAQATATKVAAADANTMLIGLGASIPNLVNAATGTITTATDGPLGGGPTALWIQSGATLGAISNAGTISANAVTTDPVNTASLTAYAIRDASGSLTQISNSGVISTAASLLNNNAQVTVAVDASVSSLAMTFNNSGVVTGDVRLGNNSASQLTIAGSKASLTGNISTTAAGRVAISVSPGGAGGSLETASINKASTFTVGSGGTLTLDVGQNTTVVNASGAASLDANSHLVIKTVSLLPRGNISLVHSDTTVTINGNLSTIAAGFTLPYLYTGTLGSDAKNLTLSVARKSATDLGLTGAASTLYDPVLTAAPNDPALADALGTLPDAQHLQAALAQFQPADLGYVRAAGAFLTDPNSDAVGARQRRLTLAPQAAGFGSWVAGGFDQLSFSGADGHGFGATFGIDFTGGQNNHFGIAFTLDETHINEDVNNAATKATWYIFSPYLGFHANNFFVNAQFNAGGATVSLSRSVTIGTENRVSLGDTSETVVSGGAVGGYIFNFARWSLAPEMSLSAFKMNNGLYTESGGGKGVDLSVDPQDLTAVHAFAGIAVSSNYELFGGHFVPQLLAGWNQSIGASETTTTAHFVSEPGQSFSLIGPQTEHSGLLGAAHVDFGNDYTTISLGYDGTFGGNAKMHSGNLRISSRF